MNLAVIEANSYELKLLPTPLPWYCLNSVAYVIDLGQSKNFLQENRNISCQYNVFPKCFSLFNIRMLRTLSTKPLTKLMLALN
jgi:hypothetical protein